MAVPKGKISKQRKHTRRAANWKLSAPSITKCPRCQKTKLSHRACPHCGYYRSEAVIKVESGDSKKDKQAKEA